MNTDTLIGLEGPLFGYFARQMVKVEHGEFEACLKEYRQAGGRLGEIFRKRGLLTRAQVIEVLRLEAEWVATAMETDRDNAFPRDTCLSLCMPAFNEEENIENTLDAACAILPAFVRRFEIIVVDDGSKDRTGETVARYAEKEPRVRLVSHQGNQGYGAAVTSGMREARGDLVAFTDSDGQFSFLDLPQLLTRLEGADVVVGYRHKRADNCVRRLNAWAWNRLIRVLLGIRVRDLDCAFKLFRREVVDSLSLTARGATINAEILAQCVHSGLTIRETPVSHYPRLHGAPTGGALKVIAKAFRDLPQLCKYRAPKVVRLDASMAMFSSGRAGLTPAVHP